MSSDQLSPLIADLHLLTVLAATRSFTETARRLGVSKASASMRISELERAAGVLLVRRTTRSVGLTEAGQQLVHEMQPAFNRISESYNAARDLVGAPRGLVRVTAPVALGRQHLAPCVAAFLQRFPDIHIELELTDRFVNLANEGFDLAIRHTNTVPETHVAWVLCETRASLMASPQYLARRGMPMHPSELSAHDCLLYLRDSHAGNWTFVRQLARKGKRQFAEPALERLGVSVAGTLKVNNSEVLRDALLAGLGIGLLPDFSMPLDMAPTLVAARTALPPEGAGLAWGGPAQRPMTPALSTCQTLVPVLPDWQVQGFFGERIYALRPWSAQVPKAVQCLVEHLRQSFAQGFGAAMASPAPR
ncbi:transcriptional regulator, LysR family [Polaromonas sp. OV174]|uniref:LysR substrate-binding domain-containing protein n=1 Tax=Polaromonas sp. OV174 TaxID=1855300 RepID=UPI0008ECA4E6|nr:LysR family transcriptional regulator [Polaromonas sp. OV174]SFC21358.1 transcriptional regulator, LysR family [Polaromonas sp. OV174]